MRGPELHSLLVTRPAPLPAAAGRRPAADAEASPVRVGTPSVGSPAPDGGARPGVAPQRQLASGGYQVHNGRPAASVVVG